MNNLIRVFATAAFATLLTAAPLLAADAVTNAPFRPPAVPLVVSDPYLSIWSEGDALGGDATRHWTRHEHSLVSLIRIDGVNYRLMGNEPAAWPAIRQSGVHVTPTRTIYDFQGFKVHVTITFMTPALPDDLDVLTRPVTYITWTVSSSDGLPHEVEIYDSTSSQLAVNKTDEPVEWARETAGDLTALHVGTKAQPVLGSAGDDLRINWGYAYAAAPGAQAQAAIGGSADLLNSFLAKGSLPAQDDTNMPRAVSNNTPVLAFVFNLGTNVTAEAVSRHALVAYDEIYSIKYFGKKLQPYWRRNGASATDILQAAEKDYASLTKRCETFDQNLTADLTKVGGAKYAQIAALAYRQALGATGIAADANKQPLLFTKENTSNGDIATVDVIFPMDPIFLLLNPTLAKASIVPVLSYAASPHWKFPNAPHDLGTYPIARGTDDGGEGMPVEESGNLLILCDAIAQIDGNANFVKPWWPKLTQWAEYLQKYGLDPEEQLCTDDFMGHLAHNANLSVKAILGLAAYGDLCKIRGEHHEAKKYAALAKTDADHWVQVALENGHYRLAFDKTNTWSQKYNLVWDHLLGLDIFPTNVAQQEVTFYKAMLQTYGVPLDSRTKLTKTDWSIWSATLADDKADFEMLVNPIYDYLNQTSARIPLADSYVTDQVGSEGMHARSVVGGVFIKMLSDRAIWKKWAGADHTKPGKWAPLPIAPQVKDVIPTSQKTRATWLYTTNKPADNWTQPNFDASAWQSGPAGFGTQGTPGAVIGTLWNTGDIWLRREVTFPAGNFSNLQFSVYHDEDVDIYVNGVPAASEAGFNGSYVELEINPPARVLLAPGAKVTLAAHCHQTIGGQGVDVGLVDVVETTK